MAIPAFLLRILELELEQVGPFGKLKLEFKSNEKLKKGKAEIHIFSGENGTGKTTIMEMLALQLKPWLRQSNHRRYRKAYPKSKAEAYVGYVNPPGWPAYARSMENWVETELNNYWNNRDNRDYEYTFAFFAYSGYRRLNNVDIQGVIDLRINPQGNELSLEDASNDGQILQWIVNSKAYEAISLNQGRVEDAKRYSEALINLEYIISKIIGKRIQFKIEAPTFKVVISQNGEDVEYNLLPDGLKSIISWIGDLLMRLDSVKWANNTPIFERPFILFLDEIEVHMHPAWQRKILPAVQELFPNAQIFISTHSPFVIGSVDGAWIYKFVKPNGDSQLAEGYPMLSEDARSVRYWLDEVFDISSEFGLEAEKQLKAFYVLRDKVLAGKSNTTELLNAGRELAIQSDEMRHIIEMEIRQINRRKSLVLSLQCLSKNQT